MAAIRFNDPIEPMTIANMRESGVRSLAFRCHRCHHERTMNADSDEVARAFRDDVARCSDMMSPGVWRLAGRQFFAFGEGPVNPWLSCWRASVAGYGR
jgi:hypothetical protein